jgi:hypothetical protein
MGVKEIEAKIAENTVAQWKTQQKMSEEAYPYLFEKKLDDDMNITARASDLANYERLTTVCENRRLKRVIDVNEALNSDGRSKKFDEKNLCYAISTGRVENAKDRNKIYHVEYDEQYAAMELISRGEIKVPSAQIPCQGFNLLLERKYVGLLSVFSERLVAEVSKQFKGTDPRYVRSAIDSLLAADLTDSHTDEPDISHANTSDYVIYTCSSAFETIVEAVKKIRIRRRMVVASLRFSNPPINIPLAEEFFIEVLSKTDGGVFDNSDAPFATDKYSVVLNFTLVSDQQTHQAGAANQPCNASTINFFGKNAFSLLVGGHTPSNKSHYSTGHEAAMYMMGWLIRQLGSAASCIECDAGPKELEKHGVFGTFAKSRGNTAKFVTEQNAKSFITKIKRKNFYTKTWLVSQSLAVITITHAEQTAKSIVMVWSGGRLITDTNLLPLAPLRRSAGVLAGEGEAPPALAREGSRRFAEPLVDSTRGGSTGSKFTSSLPLHLERELQLL